MKINKVHCFFEQSGTFRDAFKANGIDAIDYDIENQFSQTDVVCDLFAEIDNAYNHTSSLFDNINSDDLIFAFFPCTYFCECNQLYFSGNSNVQKKYSQVTKIKDIIERSTARQRNYELLLKLCAICIERGLRLIVENPYSVNHYLYNNFPFRPAIIDKNRAAHGDFFTKPTQYFCIGFTPNLGGRSYLPRKCKKIQRAMSGRTKSDRINRSLITPEYADLFIKDYLLAVHSNYTQLTLFSYD